MSRRDLIKQGALIGAAAAAMRPAGAAEKATASLPKIKLGDLEVSRLILGSNPFYGFAHRGGAWSEEMKEYYTDERICRVLEDAAASGVTAVASPPYRRWIRLFNDYLKRGGKLRIWIAQPDGDPAKMKAEITSAVKGGAKAVFIQGGRVDAQFAKGSFDVLRGWVEHIKSFAVPAGMAAHRPDVHLEAEKRKFPTDFYFQCFYANTKFRKEDPAKAVAAIKKLDKPVVGYKILAAGRTPPKEGFTFALSHIRRKDGVCVGIFPKYKPNQVDEDAGLTRTLSKRAWARK